ncbi:MAG: single-stranded-DNA-specific exonuclease RecJ, partial [Ruminococcus sp.]|nr:single-stranded-DNA-specific exonuclease RecJ [Ruminococcus sp.]
MKITQRKLNKTQQGFVAKYGTVIAHCLAGAGISDLGDAHNYLNEGALCDSRLLPNITAVEKVIVDAMYTGKKAVVFGDYDCDGVTAAAIMSKALIKCGLETAVMLPSRDEGYGLKMFHIEEMIKQKTGLLVTVDCGIKSLDEIAYAKKNGMRVIVLDHHIPGNLIPMADAIIDLHWINGNYPNKNLTGSGLAYKVAQHFDEDNSMEDIDLAALGTIADVEDIGSGENRNLVKKALMRIRNAGLIALNDSGSQLTAEDIAFGIAPKVNACGRLEHNGAAKPLNLFLSNDFDEIKFAAENLTDVNNQRKAIQADCYDTIKADAEAQVNNKAKVIVCLCEKAPAGIVGLLAGRLKEKYNRPVIVFGRKDENILVASARSVPGFNLVAALDAHRGLLEAYGGHELAAGLSIKQENLERLKKALNAECKLTDEQLEPTIEYSFEIEADKIDDKIFSDLNRCEPFGQGNPKPIFKVKVKTQPINNGSYATFGANG